MTKAEIDAPTPEQLLDQWREGHILERSQLEAIIRHYEVLERNTLALMKNLAIEDRRPCHKCGALIWLLPSYNKKTQKIGKYPVTGNFLNHYADCPHAAEFRKGVRS